jgi:acyl-CoA synthetase (AMP-forming)/AMP-acid ligase II
MLMVFTCACQARPTREPDTLNETTDAWGPSIGKKAAALRAPTGRRMLAKREDTAMNIAAWLRRNGKSFADRPALSRGRTVYSTYARWAARAAAIAGGLARQPGYRPGERVAIAMTNRPEYLEALFGIWHAGLVAVPINAKLHREEFRYILGHSGARLCFASSDLAETVAPLADDLPELARVVVAGDAEWHTLGASDGIDLVERRPEDPAWLFYTSGTTGRPKGATLTNRNLIAMCLGYFSDVDPIAPTDAKLHAAPLSHGSGLYGLPHVARAANNIIPDSGHFDPAEIADLLPVWPGLSLFAAPTMLTRLVANPTFAGADHRNLKAIVYGGGPMYVTDLLKALELLGPRLVQIYGQGESPMTITALARAFHMDRNHPRWRERLGSVGLPFAGIELRVVDGEDRDMPAGEPGEVLARGDSVMAGYWRNDKATAETLRGGWLHTGDVGALDADGFLTLRDRSKDMIISGGSNIYPREIEEVLLRHPAIAEVSVVGRPHADWGEEVVAFVVPRPGVRVAEPELDRLCLDSIARFKRPRAYRFVDTLPKNNYGKVLKTELRRLLKEGERSAG